MIIAILATLLLVSLAGYWYTKRKQDEETDKIRALIANKLVGLAKEIDETEEPRELKRDDYQRNEGEDDGGVVLGEKVKEGVTFISDISCQVVKIFYDTDRKFAIVCPVIRSKLADIPGVVEVKDGDRLSWDSIGTLEQDVVVKAVNVYNEYKRENKEKFSRGIE